MPADFLDTSAPAYWSGTIRMPSVYCANTGQFEGFVRLMHYNWP